MASIVKVPRNNTADYDFIAFSFDGKHSIEDFGIYRVSDNNNGYNINLSVASEDKTATVPGMDGKYFLGSQKKEKVFDIKIAFDHLTEEKLDEAKRWLNTGRVADLWFAEAPHKVYGAKVTGLSTATTLIIDEADERIYKGTGSIQFTCYNPYAHTPDEVWYEYGEKKKTIRKMPGMTHLSYQLFSNYDRIKKSLPLYEILEEQENVFGETELISKGAAASAFGDLPFYFVANLAPIDTKTKFEFIADITGEEYIISEAEQENIGGNYYIYIQNNIIEEET